MENVTSNYDALYAAAEKATKGNWINVGAWVENERDDLKDICDCRPNGNEDYEQALLDATFISLANPDTILQLLRERRTALEAASGERAVIEPLTEPVTISKALRAGRVARVEGTASAATAFLANIQIAPWGQSKEWVQGYVDGFNRAAKWMQDALNSTPAYAGAAIRNSALEEAAQAITDHQRDGRAWIRENLWDTLNAEAASRIRALQSTSQSTPAAPISSAPAWISVSDRLPPNDTWILAHNGKWTGVAMYASAAEFLDESWPDERREFIELLGPAVTHWTPLPAAPASAQAKHTGTTTTSTHAVRDMLAERRRQVLHEGMTSDQDDCYTEAELPRAAASYILSACGFSNAITLDFWPWSTDWWKPTTPRRNLVKAAALIIAELERIDRDPGDESHHDHLNGGSL